MINSPGYLYVWVIIMSLNKIVGIKNVIKVSLMNTHKNFDL